jgi:hypothetical protein
VRLVGVDRTGSATVLEPGTAEETVVIAVQLDPARAEGSP